MAAKKTVSEDALETRFVDEYLVDFDQYLAAIRAGVPRLQAKPKSKVLMSTMAVQKAIIARVDAKPEPAAETGDTAKSRKYLKRVIEEYSTSDEAKLAKTKMAEIR